MKTHIGTNAYLGGYHSTVRVNGRAVIGVGHTVGEAWRNACDGHAERNPDLDGVMAVLRTMPPREKKPAPAPAKQSLWRTALKEFAGFIVCLLALSPVIVASAVVFGGAP